MTSRTAVFLAAFVLLAACQTLPDILSSPAPEVGAMAPDFTLNDLVGIRVSLSSLRGQVVLLNFWATWCGPCVQELPTIQQRYNGGGFAVLAINFDESQEKVAGFMTELGVNLPVLLDPGGKVQELYRVRGYPTSFFLDSDGVIRIIHIGQMNQSDLNDYLDQLISQK